VNDNETKVSLVVVEGTHAGRALPVRSPFLIGRAAECQLRPASEQVSLQHCVIEDRPGCAVVRDLSSATGTFVNDDRLMSDYQLRDGDELRVGPLRFTVRVEEPIHLTEDATNDAAARFLLDEEEEAKAADTKLPTEEQAAWSVRQAKK